MSAALSYHDAAYATVSPTRRETRSGRRESREAGAEGGSRALVRVPDLNWPSNLFGDNVGVAELALLAEDFPFQWDQVN